jgi:lipoprotein-releasing system ATP-binding protein
MPEAVPHPALFLWQIERRFTDAERTIEVLRRADLAVWPGQTVALIAPSGTGKSTLLQIAGLLEKPDAGDVYIGSRPTAALDDDSRTAMRRTEIGFVYQSHRLLPEFTALENVMMPQLIGGLARADAERRAREILGYLGLGERLGHRPSELSGGEQQRVAIARAVANRPRILLADEPTGNLDPKTSAHVFDTLLGLARVSRLAAVVATHNLELAARMDRRVTLRDGVVIELD